MPANAEYMRAYRKRRPEYAAKSDADTKALRVVKINYIRDYKTAHGCADCGEKDWIVLELDHKDRSTKLYTPSRLHHMSWNTIHEELSKCEVRCANCHRRRTYNEKHWMGKAGGSSKGTVNPRSSGE